MFEHNRVYSEIEQKMRSRCKYLAVYNTYRRLKQRAGVRIARKDPSL